MRLIDADALEEKLDKIPARRIENADGRAYVLIRLSTVLEIIKQMPSAQPEQRWILCDEIMPEEHEWIGTKQFGTTMSDEVYVTFENSKGERFTKHLHFHNGDLSRYDKTHMDAWFKKDYKPIAWMPLPEPYKGEQHG